MAREGQRSGGLSGTGGVGEANVVSLSPHPLEEMEAEEKPWLCRQSSGRSKPPPPGPQGAQPLPLSRMSRVTVALMCFGVGQRFLSGENMSSNASKPKTLEMEHRMRPGQLGGRQVQGPAPGH